MIPKNGRVDFFDPDVSRRDRTGWLGRLDSNQGMAESKSAALPLGYAPMRGADHNGAAAGRQLVRAGTRGRGAPAALNVHRCAAFHYILGRMPQSRSWRNGMRRDAPRRRAGRVACPAFTVRSRAAVRGAKAGVSSHWASTWASTGASTRIARRLTHRSKRGDIGPSGRPCFATLGLRPSSSARGGSGNPGADADAMWRNGRTKPTQKHQRFQCREIIGRQGRGAPAGGLPDQPDLAPPAARPAILAKQS
jgi:hypothetical protein